MTKVSIKILRELYRVDNKCWKTGDIDILPKRSELERMVDDRFWSEIGAVVSIATRKHLPVQAVVDALKPLGYEVVEENNDGEQDDE